MAWKGRDSRPTESDDDCEVATAFFQKTVNFLPLKVARRLFRRASFTSDAVLTYPFRPPSTTPNLNVLKIIAHHHLRLRKYLSPETGSRTTVALDVKYRELCAVVLSTEVGIIRGPYGR